MDQENTVTSYETNQYSTVVISKPETFAKMVSRMRPIILDFQVKLFQDVAIGFKNIVFSPVLLLAKLVMEANFSCGQTRDELLHFIFGHKNLSPEEEVCFKHAVKDYLSEMKRTSYTMFTSNFYLDTMYCDTVKPHFRQEASHYFACSVRPVSFTSNLYSAIREINEDVYLSTYGNIKSVVYSIGEDVKALLVDAAYFRGIPQIVFDPNLSFRDIFATNSKNCAGDPLIHREIAYIRGTGVVRTGVHEQLNCLVVDIPYKFSEVSLKIILPPLDVPAHSFLLNSDSSLLSDAILNNSKLTEKTVDLKIPKLLVSTKLGFKALLAKLEVGSLFGTKCDASAMSLSKDSSRGFSIDELVQKAIFHLDESEGMTAAEKGDDAGELELQIARPFLLAVTWGPENNKIILFLGIINDPFEFEPNKF